MYDGFFIKKYLGTPEEGTPTLQDLGKREKELIVLLPRHIRASWSSNVMLVFRRRRWRWRWWWCIQQLFDLFNDALETAGTFVVALIFSCDDLRCCFDGMAIGSRRVRLVITRFYVIKALVTRDVEGLQPRSPALRLRAYKKTIL